MKTKTYIEKCIHCEISAALFYHKLQWTSLNTAMVVIKMVLLQVNIVNQIIVKHSTKKKDCPRGFSLPFIGYSLLAKFHTQKPLVF